MDDVGKFLTEALAISYNYLLTGRPNKAIETISVVSKIDPENILAKELMSFIYAVEFGEHYPDLTSHFGKLWLGFFVTRAWAISLTCFGMYKKSSKGGIVELF